ncbi:MAG: hypothetical protein CM15mP74_01740 [Halieaceae bacterium]|nr:MAG: hypothetical protein CM15mP74_01740 [Halieaceae bacterium]
MGMQYGLCVAAWLGYAGKHQLTSRFKSVTIREVSSHWPITGVSLILLVYHRGHAGQCFSDLILADHAVMQPVGDVLAGDAQRARSSISPIS